MSDAMWVVDASNSVIVGDDGRTRCRWAGTDREYQRYHDEEWGRPLHGDLALFEKLSLEAFQAGLSWITILRRRTAFREAFDGFDPHVVGGYGSEDVERLMADDRIIRNRAKIMATISNARLTLHLMSGTDGALDELMWGFAPAARPARFSSMTDIPTFSPESTAMSGALRGLGFTFVGPTTMYALMQSTGMVDDHVETCWRAR